MTSRTHSPEMSPPPPPSNINNNKKIPDQANQADRNLKEKSC